MTTHKLSQVAENLGTLSVARIAIEVNKMIAKGEEIYDLTIGDFNPKYFPIPQALEDEIIQAYRNKQTNYPRGGNFRELLTSLAGYIKEQDNLAYKEEEFTVASGARPLIYTLFKTLLDPGDKVIYPVPSWNNHNFVQLNSAVPITIQTKPENNFMPTAEELAPLIHDATLIVINAPLNPAGTVFKKNSTALRGIIDLVVAENRHRDKKQKRLYIMFDIVYRALCQPNNIYNLLSQNDEAREYIIFIDAISKCFASTGLRVGWAFGPQAIISKMNAISSHFGAWAGKPEQVGLAKFLRKKEAMNDYLQVFTSALLNRLNIFYAACQQLKDSMGSARIDAIAPTGALYLSVKLHLIGMHTRDNKVLNTVDDIVAYLMQEAHLAVVPFYIFGTDANCPWYRVSVGNCSIEEISIAAKKFTLAIVALKN